MAKVNKTYTIASNYSYTGNSNNYKTYNVSDVQNWLTNNIPSNATITSATLWINGYWTPNSETFGGSMKFGVRCWFCASSGDDSGTKLLGATFEKNNTNGYYASNTIQGYIQTTYPFTIYTSYPYINFYIAGEQNYTQKRTFYVTTYALTIEYEEHEHSYTSTVTTPATCMSAGVRTYTCSCGQGSYTESIAKDPNNHAGGTEVKGAYAATCASTGYTGDTYCKGCGAKISSGYTIDKTTTHTEVPILGKDPTCTSEGLTEGKECSVCGEITLAQRPIAPLGHDYVSEVTKQPTCTETGVRTYTCRNDSSHKYTEEIPALGHSWVAATCTAPKTCSVCGATEGSALGHSWIAATCTAPKKCSVCGATEGSALGHSFTNYISDNNATCTTDGTKTAKCDRCSVTNTITDVGSALGHSFTNYVSNNDATCTSDGTKTAKCDRCSVTNTIADVGSALGHTHGEPVQENFIDSTCTAEGSYDEVTYCKVCHAELSRVKKTIAKKDHVYVDEVVPPTLEANGYTKHVCSCGHSTDNTNPTCLARFLNGNGEVLEDVIVEKGGTPTPTKTPTKAYDDDCTYDWSPIDPWLPAITPITQGQVYEPVFGAVQYYTVDMSLLDKVAGWKSQYFGVQSGYQHPSGSDKFTYGSVIRIEIELEDGYLLTSWEDGSTDNPRTITVTDNISINATFEKIYYKLDHIGMRVEGSGGYSIYLVEGDRRDDDYYSHGSIVEVSTSAKEGYTFVCWEDGSTENPRTIIMTKDISISAVYEKIPSAVPIYVNEIPAKAVYVNPTTKTIIIVIDGEVPEVTKDNDTLDDWHFEVVNTVPSGCYLVEKIYRNEIQIM